MRLLAALILSGALYGQSSFYIATGNSLPYTDTSGQVWIADNGTSCQGGTVFASSTNVTGTSDPTLYQHGRIGTNLSCSANLSQGIYTITLKFADVRGFTAGQQIFNVFINGTLQKANFDIFNTVRAQNVAYDVVLSYSNLGSNVAVQVAQVSGTAQLQAVSIVTVAANNSWLQIANPPFQDVRRFNFAAQQPGGSLAIGANTITMTPVPLGVNGTDQRHYLNISGGTGTAEPCLISGGSGVAGQLSGQIQITCSNTHTGAWLVTSASAGGVEAIYALPLDSTFTAYHSGTVIFPDGYYNLQAGIEVYLQLVTLEGVSRSGAVLNFASTIPNPAFRFTCDSQDPPPLGRNRVGLHHLTINNSSTSQDSVVVSGYGGNGGVADMVSDTVIYGGARGLAVLLSQTSGFRDLVISNFQTYGIYQDLSDAQGESSFNQVVISSPALNTAVGFAAVATNTNLAGTVFGADIRMYGSYSIGYLIKGLGGLTSIFVIGNRWVFDGAATTAGLSVETARNVQIDTSFFSNASPGATFGAQLVGSDMVRFTNTVFGSNAASGAGGDLYLGSAASKTALVNCDFGGNYRHLRLDTVSPPTKLVLRGNLPYDTSIPVVTSAEYTAFAAATEQSTDDTSSHWRFNASSYLNDLVFENIEAGATNPFKYLNVTNLGSVEWLSNGRSIIRHMTNEGYDALPVGADVASGATIAPTGPVFRVTGAANISTITVPTSLTVSLSGRFTTVPTGAFTWDTAGNIGAVGTAVVGKAITWIYLPATSKWYASQ